jgi:hypothetical protein
VLVPPHSVRNDLTPVQNMKAQGVIDWSVFGFYLGKNNADGETPTPLPPSHTTGRSP